MREQEANLKLETTAEISIGKEISLVNLKDFNHLDLVIEAKNNRLKAEFFYIYDYEKFNNCSLMRSNFNIFNVKNGVNHTSSRIVIHYITKELKRRFEEYKKKEKTNGLKHNLTEIFKPSLNQFNDSDLVIANDFIKSMFPYEGCSYTGLKLEEIIRPARFLTLVLALRIIWSLLPGAIIPWKSFKNYIKNEEVKYNYKNYRSFYSNLPTFLPSYNHSCILFEFLEIFLTIFKNDYFLDLSNSIDLIFTAGQICFNRDEYRASDGSSDDLPELHKFYYKRGYSFHTIFVAYLRALSKETNSSSPVEFKNLFDFFKIEQYPPLEHKPSSQKALTLTIPTYIEGDEFDIEDGSNNEVNYFKLLSNASNSTSRIYSSNHSFTKFENKFLDKFEIDPHKIIENFFSKSSKNYLLKFDDKLNFDDFKINENISDMRSNLKKNATLFDNKEFVSTFINEFNRYGFESNGAGDLKNSNSGTFLNDTINFNFSSNFETVNKLPVRISKLDITEWFINSWKYETFLGFLTNTIVVKLTKTIGDCDWLIISSNDKISTNNRYLTPSEKIDIQKELELNGVSSPQSSGNKVVTPKKSKSPKQMKRKSPNSKGLKDISFPSRPTNYEDNTKGFNEPLSSNTGKNFMNRINAANADKPLPAPVIPNQRITTPTNQIIEGFSDYDTPSGGNGEFLPPPLVRNTVNDNSLVSNDFGNGWNLNDHSELQAIIDEADNKSASEFSMVTESTSGNSLDKPFSKKNERRVSSHPYQNFRTSPPRTKLQNEQKLSSETLTENETEQEVEEADEDGVVNDDIMAQVLKLEDDNTSDSPVTITTLTENKPVVEEFQTHSAPTPTLRSRSTSHFETPPASATERFPNSQVRRQLTKVKTNLSSSKSIKSTVQSAASPMKSFPKLSFLSGKKDRLKTMTSSVSNNSLSFINDGTEKDSIEESKKSTISSKGSRRPSDNSRSSSTSAVETAPQSASSEFPEIPYTPKAMREGFTSSNTGLSDEFDGVAPGKALDDVISLNRDNFISNSPKISPEEFTTGNDLNISDEETYLNETRNENEITTISDTISETNESILTADTTRSAGNWRSHTNVQSVQGINDNLDGLMKQISETMDSHTDNYLRSEN